MKKTLICTLTFLHLFFSISYSHTSYPQKHFKRLPQLPAEIWHNIASFLPGNDPALRWFLTFLALTDTQADKWIKKYHRDTQGKNPLTLFGSHPVLEQAWLRFKQQRKAAEQAIITSDRDFIQRYLETEYAALLEACTQMTPEQLVSLKKDIYYALTCLEKYYYMAKNQTTNTISIYTLKILQLFIGILSFTVGGFTLMITLINYYTNNDRIQKLQYLHCLNGTTAYDDDLHIYNQKHSLCQHYAAHFTTRFNYVSLVSVTAVLLLLNSTLYIYIRNVSLKHQVTQDIKYLIMSYYNQLRAYKQCIIDLTSDVSH